MTWANFFLMFIDRLRLNGEVVTFERLWHLVPGIRWVRIKVEAEAKVEDVEK